MEIEITQEAKQEAAESKEILARVTGIEIKTNEEFDHAAIDLKRVKAKAKELDATRKSITQPIDAAKKRVMDFFREPLDFLARAEKELKRGMITYQDRQEQIRLQAEAKAREQARKEREKLEAQAARLAEKGKAEAAQARLEAAEHIPSPVVNIPKPEVKGVSTREIWSAEVTDKRALVKAVADGIVPDVVLSVDMKILNAQARALKSALNYPGVKAVMEKSLSARSA